MAEYIEREAVLAAINEVMEDYAGEHSFSTDFAAAVVCELRDNVVATITAADVVPVVRCKDCIHGELDDPELVFAYYCKHDRCSWHKADHFCAYGERRDTDD